MKERPILFSAEMVRAILDGRKSQTRRMVKRDCLSREQKKIGFEQNFDFATPGDLSWIARIGGDREGVAVLARDQQLNVPVRHPDEKNDLKFSWDDCARERMYCPYGQVLERLWVKETFSSHGAFGASGKISYRADISDGKEPHGLNWKPSIFMPRRASRITLEITKVRVERLQGISEQDAMAEGVEIITSVDHGSTNAITAYKTLWESINGDGSWAANPWVWCLMFRKI